MTLEDAASICEIQQLLFRYCRAADRGDVELMKSVFHPGASDHHGGFSGPADVFVERAVSAMDAAGRVGQHHITNTLIQIEGARARAETYFVAYHPDAAGLALIGGRYLDRLERRDNAWKIIHRTTIVDFAREPSAESLWARCAGYPQGGRREADPSFAFFSSSSRL